MPNSETLIGLRDERLTPKQTADREAIARAHGVTFRTDEDGRTVYSLPEPRDWGVVRDAIKAADLALNDCAPRARW